ncbi:MAG TPA: hypothetical protein DEP91_02830 [Sphingomonas bacterium]|jgi:hypothetical protein|uniref:Uncharacterized protein n=1 Tax=Sphingomonas bacterium TaxID=1895847 RepID=A0A3D0WAU6_9SPHN|nr:hypothetical protein [Sphingomonas bacterium]
MPVTADARGGRRLPRQTQYFDPHTIKAIFENPATGWRESVPNRAWLWMLLFGGFYLIARSMWRPLAISTLIVVLVGAVAWPLLFLLIPGIWVFDATHAERMMRAHYLRQGWYEIDRWHQDDLADD